MSEEMSEEMSRDVLHNGDLPKSKTEENGLRLHYVTDISPGICIAAIESHKPQYVNEQW